MPDMTAAATTLALANFMEQAIHAMAGHLRDHHEEAKRIVARAYIAETGDPEPSTTTSRAPNARELRHDGHIQYVAGDCPLCDPA